MNFVMIPWIKLHPRRCNVKMKERFIVVNKKKCCQHMLGKILSPIIKYISIFEHISGWFLVWLSSPTQGAGWLLRTVHVIFLGNRHCEINVIHNWSMVHLKLSLRGRESFFLHQDQRGPGFHNLQFYSVPLSKEPDQLLSGSQTLTTGGPWAVCRGKKGWSIVVSDVFVTFLIALANHPKNNGRKKGFAFAHIWGFSLLWRTVWPQARRGHTLSVSRKLGNEFCSLAWVLHGSF